MPDYGVVNNSPNRSGSITLERIWREGIDTMFLARTVDPNGNATYVVQPSAIWDNVNGLSATGRTAAVYSRDAIKFPRLSFKGQMPSWSGNDDGNDRLCYVGFENGGSAGNLLLSFLFERNVSNVNALSVVCYDDFSSQTSFLASVTSNAGYTPSNWVTNIHNYSLSVHKYFAYWTIDTVPLAFVTFAPNYRNFASLNNRPPYIYGNMSVPAIIALNSLFEIDCPGVITTTTKTAIPILQNFRIAEGTDIPSFDMSLYSDEVNTTVGGIKITTKTPGAAASVTTLGLPIIGFGTKKILWQASVVGSMQIQILDTGGTWRSADPPVGTPAGSPVEIPILSDGVYARAVWTNNSAGAAAIATAEYIARP